MAHDPLLTGYARALLELAQAEGVLPRVQEELFRLRGESLRANPELLRFLRDSNIKPDGKRQALTELLGGRAHPLVLNFLFLLHDLDRSRNLLAVLDEFAAQAGASQQRISGEVTTAVPLAAATRERLTAELSRWTGKNVQLFEKVDPAILGGAVIQIGEQIIDGSLRRKLDQLKTKLTQ